MFGGKNNQQLGLGSFKADGFQMRRKICVEITCSFLAPHEISDVGAFVDATSSAR